MSPRTEETNQRIREEQKERILKAARAVFAYKGFTDTKMTDIAAAAGVSYGLAYHYFKNKEEFLADIHSYFFWRACGPLWGKRERGLLHTVPRTACLALRQGGSPLHPQL